MPAIAPRLYSKLRAFLGRFVEKRTTPTDVTRPESLAEVPVSQPSHDQRIPGFDSAAVRGRLLQLGRSVTADTSMPALVPDASRLISENSFAFLLGAALDRGMPAEVAWTIPYWLRQELGHLDPPRLADMTEAELLAVVSRLPRRPRYIRDAPRTIREVARLVKSLGDAEMLWEGRSADEVKRQLKAIHGIGEGIASMVVVLLEKYRGVRFLDRARMNVKADVHVQRVLYRLGAARGRSEAEAISAATALNPEYPGDLDQALWTIGQRWCHESTPQCVSCPITDLCMRAGL
jgi:endonuclease III